MTPLDPEDVMKNWRPEVVRKYCTDYDLVAMSEEGSFYLVQQFSKCPIKEFQDAGVTENLIICILTDECETLFETGKLNKADFAPVQITFERQDPKELVVTPETFGDNEYCELFNQVFSQFLFQFF